MYFIHLCDLQNITEKDIESNIYVYREKKKKS